MQSTLEQTDNLGHLEQQKKERSLQDGLNEARHDSSEEEDTTDNTVEKDQSEMQEMHTLNQKKFQAKRSAKIDAKKMAKAIEDRAVKFLVQKVGMRAATAMFLASIIGAIVGLALVIGRLIAVDLFHKESQKFDSIVEELTYRAVAILLIIILFILMALITFIIMKFSGIFGSIYKFLSFFHINLTIIK